MAQFQCPKCGKILEKGIPQCPTCGARFNWSNNPNLPKAPAAPQQAQQQPQMRQQYQQPQQTQQTPYYQQPQGNGTQPKKKSRVGLIITGVILILLLSCCTSMCSSDDSNSNNDSTTNNSSTQKNNNAYQDKGTLGDYEIEILSAKVTKDWEGKDAVIVEFKFTNNSDEAQSFMVAISDQVFQDGIELESAIVTDKDYNVDNQVKEIKPGKSINVQAAFLLNDTTTPIEVEVSELISFSDKKVVKTFDIAQ